MRKTMPRAVSPRCTRSKCAAAPDERLSTSRGASATTAWLRSRFESSTRMGWASTFSWSSGSSSAMRPTRNERSRSM